MESFKGFIRWPFEWRTHMAKAENSGGGQPRSGQPQTFERTDRAEHFGCQGEYTTIINEGLQGTKGHVTGHEQKGFTGGQSTGTPMLLPRGGSVRLPQPPTQQGP